ncbi:MAG TPA: alpha-amylase family glycosyl hydrolase [Puia sp.]|nr:alpha-amylase family glycosyl hydrolase [Puia sp.]
MNWLYIALIAAACHKTGDAPTSPPDPPPVNTDTLPAQYGTPYTETPAAQDAIIYQVNMRAFSPQGNFKGVQDRLDSIRALGVNVLYLMPTYPVGVVKSVNSPYCVKDYAGVNPEFGTLADLRSLVDQAHARHMAVLFDWVADHTSWDNPWITQHPDWYMKDGAGNIISPPNTGWNDVAALNFTNTTMRKAMIRAMQYWVYTANIDGYRCDAADFIPFDFWQAALDSLQHIPNHKLLLFAEGTRKDHFMAGFQLEYGMGFYYTLRDQVYKAGRTVKLIDSLNTAEYTNATAGAQVVRYISNHDVDNSDGTPLDLFGGQTGSMAAFIVAAYMKGVPMIYNGQEVDCPIKLNFFNNSTTIDWTINADVWMEYKKLIAFRNNSATLRNGTLQSYASDDACVFTKTTGNNTVLTMVNLRNAPVTYTFPAALANTDWTDVFDGTSQHAGMTITLPAYGYKVWQR